MQLFDWLLCFLLKSSHQKLFQCLKDGKDLFTARNENQVFYSKTLSLVFMEVINKIINTYFIGEFLLSKKKNMKTKNQPIKIKT